MIVTHTVAKRAAAATDGFDCRRCGACCAAFRVSFYWAEAEAVGLPSTLIEQIGPWYACMAGSNGPSPHCRALQGEVGHRVSCSVYGQRPSPCRELQVGDARCSDARHRHGLPALSDATTIDLSPTSGQPVSPKW